tara:strand:- start:19 stop:489 length:471 start_codon:yes stop_codon:yes gene_type:complete
MEKRIQAKIDTYFEDFKQKICNGNDSLLKQFESIPKLVLTKDDFQKRKRNKSKISANHRCLARRADKEQCTRRRKDTLQFCGTHSKGIPHGIVDHVLSEEKRNKIQIFTQDINGIIYFLDKNNNVYNPEDIYNQESKVTKIGTYKTQDEEYIIDLF